MSTNEPLSCQKQLFSLPAGLHYLNCAYMAPLPRTVQDAGRRAIQRQSVPADIRAHDFFEDAERARVLFAQLIGAADPHRVAIIPAVSYGMAIVARNTSLKPGQHVLVSAEQFPSNVYAWRKLAKRSGASVRTVGAPTVPERAPLWNQAILDAIDENTAVVALPQVHWTDGTRFDLERIGERARQVGATFVIDGTQSVSAHPFDLQRIQPDAVVCAGYKWLLGPYGLSLAWLGARFDNADPLEETWIGRLHSEDFQRLVNYRDEYQPGAARFDVGERSSFILLPMLVAALEQVSALGAQRIQEYCETLTHSTLAEARELGFSVVDVGGRGAHLFGLRMPPGIDLGALQRTLEERRVFAALRGNALRVSPHVYNDAEDMAALIGALRAAVSAGTSAASASTVRGESATAH